MGALVTFLTFTAHVWTFSAIKTVVHASLCLQQKFSWLTERKTNTPPNATQEGHREKRHEQKAHQQKAKQQKTNEQEAPPYTLSWEIGNRSTI
jgi:hypothetical protein